jgi:DNA invertase Pin-like site-specific DNA recombinase
VLLSFAQFEREVTGERIRDKIAASKKKGLWMGGVVPLGYRVQNRALRRVDAHADLIRSIYTRYLEIGSVVQLKAASIVRASRFPSTSTGPAAALGAVASAAAICTGS